MPITARCPYCRQWKVRAPDYALGQSVTCKKCDNSFTVVETEQTAPTPTALHPSALGTKPVRPSVLATPPPAEKPPAPVEEPAELRLSAEPRPETVHEPSTDLAEEEFEAPSRPKPEGSFLIALAAFVAGSIGLMLSPTRLAHYGVTAAAAAGLAIAIFGLTRVRRRWLVPILATAFNVLILVVVIFLPSWLSLRSWRPPPERDDSEVVYAMGHDGVATPADEWIDANTSSWQRGSVRVSVGRVVVAPLELTGPDGKKVVTRESFVQLRVRVKNVGVFGAVSFNDWAASAVKLTDSAGAAFARKILDPGWEPSGRLAAAKLKPSDAVDCTLLFDAVPTNVKYLRLELPGEAFGAPGVVRLHIPWIMIQYRPSP